MGFELTYRYHEEISKGEYNKEELKSKTIKVGSPYDDISLDVLAGKVMAQLARRNILVVDVEIFEFTKKKISFKETSDGILIKNKKFSFDDGAVTHLHETTGESESPQQSNQTNDLLAQILQNPAVLAALQKQVPGVVAPTGPAVSIPKNADGRANLAPAIQPTAILRYEIYNPADKIFLEDAKRRGLAFTLGKKYPILAERAARNFNVGMFYTTIDDKGRHQVMSDKFFTPDISLSEKGFESESFKPVAMKQQSSDGLDYSGFVDDNIPSIR